jgi:hypothetical protein
MFSTLKSSCGDSQKNNESESNIIDSKNSPTKSRRTDGNLLSSQSVCEKSHSKTPVLKKTLKILRIY